MKQSRKSWTAIFRVIFIIYLILLFRLIVLKYPSSVFRDIMDGWGNFSLREILLLGIQKANFRPFRSILLYIHYFKRINGFANLIGNVCLFIPLGILFCAAYPKRTGYGLPVLFCGFYSLLMETIQLITLFGIFDVDDIILNTLGGLLGFGIFFIIEKWLISHQGGKKVQ